MVNHANIFPISATEEIFVRGQFHNFLDYFAKI